LDPVYLVIIINPFEFEEKEENNNKDRFTYEKGVNPCSIH